MLVIFWKMDDLAAYTVDNDCVQKLKNASFESWEGIKTRPNPMFASL